MSRIRSCLPPFLVLLAIAPGCFSTALSAKDLEASDKSYQIGADEFGKRMYRPAREEVTRALALNPENGDAHYLMGLLDLEQASETESMIERGACIVGDEGKLERKEVDARFRMAEESFKKSLAKRPDYSEAWNSLAVVQIYFQRWDEAIFSSEKALSNAVYRQPWTALGNLGWALYQKHEMSRASKELRTALFGNPSFCVGRYRLAKVYFDQQNWASAAEELQKVTTDKACPIQEAFLLAGMVSLKQNDRASASEQFRRCIELAPQSCLAKQCRIAE